MLTACFCGVLLSLWLGVGFLSSQMLCRGSLPLHTVRETWTMVWSWCIMSSDCIQETVICGHAHSSSPLWHGCTHTPFIGVRIKTFHRSQTRASITTANSKQPVNTSRFHFFTLNLLPYGDVYQGKLGYSTTLFYTLV